MTVDYLPSKIQLCHFLNLHEMDILSLIKNQHFVSLPFFKRNLNETETKNIFKIFLLIFNITKI